MTFTVKPETQLPTQLLSDEPEMESSLHYFQLLLLVTSLEWLWQDQTDFFIGANLTVYFSPQQIKNRQFRGPDFFLVRNTHKYPRNSWVVWEEDGRYPDVIIELLSESTASIDRNLKKNLYQNQFQTPEYFWFFPQTLEFCGFHLVDHHYEAIAANDQGWRWSAVMGLYLGVFEGKLRYFTATGELVSTPEETARREIKRANQEKLKADQEKLKADQEKLKADHQAQLANQEKLKADQERLKVDRLTLELEQEKQQRLQLLKQIQDLGINLP